jgi:hypothetical protein
LQQANNNQAQQKMKRSNVPSHVEMSAEHKPETTTDTGPALQQANNNQAKQKMECSIQVQENCKKSYSAKMYAKTAIMSLNFHAESTKPVNVRINVKQNRRDSAGQRSSSTHKFDIKSAKAEGGLKRKATATEDSVEPVSKKHKGASRSVEKGEQIPSPFMNEKLNSAHFRHLNEELYSTSGKEAFEMFQNDPEAFGIYHEGFRQQVSRWPLNPLDVVIQRLSVL